MKVLGQSRFLTAVALLLIIAGVNSLPKRRKPFLRKEALQFLRKSSDKWGLEENEELEDYEVRENEPAPPAPPTEGPAPKVHPCFNTKGNKTVTTPEGEKILCLVPSDDDLLKIIKQSGGFNNHYVAVTVEEAEEYFENPFDPIVQSQNHPEPGWIWSRGLNATGRRRRSIEDNEYETAEAISNDDRTKRSDSTGLRSCVRRGERNSMGLVHLCEECWWVTKLPDDKFPRYINERICGKDGTSISPPSDFCNSWNGQCIQRSMTQDLLVRTNRYQRIQSPDPQYSVVYKQVWEPYGQPIRSCCQCQNF